jgi:hypothetical protein
MLFLRAWPVFIAQYFIDKTGKARADRGSLGKAQAELLCYLKFH